MNEHTIASVCRTVVEGMEGALGCALVDLQDGCVLGGHAREHTPAEPTDHVTALLRADSPLVRVVAGLRRTRGLSDQQPGSAELLLLDGGQQHFAKTLNAGRLALVLVTQDSASVGMGWVRLRAAAPELQAQEGACSTS